VPSSAITGYLKQLSEPGYQHHYFVDGELTVADVYVDGEWKTVLAGSLGRGGKGVFALDVTDPDDVKFLWEKSSADIPALGNVLGKPLITQTAEGVWQVVLGNGLNSTGERAQLLMIDISSGSVTTVDTGASSNNGLAAVSGWSTYGDGITDLFYAGDFNGNVWRILVNGTAFKLFTAKDANNKAQPITATPLVGKDPSTDEIWLFFGTGQYLMEADLSNSATQTWYGIKDKQTLINDRSALVERSIVADGKINNVDVRVIETGTVTDLLDKSGWYIDLPSVGERMVVPNFFQGNVLIGTSRIPDGSDICAPTGKGFIMAINPFTGARLGKTFFDVSGDNVFNHLDTLTVDGTPTDVSGIGFGSSPNNPIFVGNVMQVVKDDGTTNTILTQGMTGAAGRTSWREIINQ
jgi:type IV pilus assembly protein PilY1